MSAKDLGPRKSIKDKSRADVLKELNDIREKEVELLNVISELGLDDKEIKALHDEVNSLRLELRSKDDEIQVQKEELSSQAEELETQLDELRCANDELERTIKQHRKLEEAHAQLASIVEASSDAIISKTLDGVITSWNHGAEQIYGYKSDEVIGKSISILASRDHPDEIPHILEKIRHGEDIVYYDTKRVRKDGTLIDVSLTVSPIKDITNRIIGAATIARDITKRKRVEEALHGSLLDAGRFREAVEHVSAYVYMKDLQSHYLYANKQTLGLFGCSAEELVGSGDDRFFPPETVKRLRDVDLRVFTGEQTCEEIDVADTGSGRRVYLEVKTPIYEDLERKTICGLLGISTDITERKQVEEALRESQAELAKAQQISHIGSWAWDLITDELTWSDQSYRNYGLAPGEVKPTYELFLSFIVPEDRERVDSAVRRAIETVEKYNVIYNIIRKDGTPRILLSENEIVKDGSGKIIRMYGTNQDITERKRAEEELNEAKKQAELYLDLMGHDINNLNQIALGYLELAVEMVEDNGVKELVAKPLDAIRNSSKLIENVRKLQKVKTGGLKLEAIDLNNLLVELKDQYLKVPGKDVAINYEPCRDCYVMANGLLRDVFSNLIGNAIKHSGPTKYVRIGLGLVRYKNDGREYCRVIVEDDGPGIPDVQKEKLFVRFQKENAKVRGKGLGLYLVNSLVDDFHGTVHVEDRIQGDYSKGARFVVTLPAVKK